MQTENLKKWSNDRATLFVLNMFVVYALWKLFAYYVKHSSGFIHESWGKIIISLGSIYATVTSFILNLFGERTVQTGISVFYPTENKIIRVEDHCLAIPATIIFVGTIVLFKGDWRTKLWFIPFGILLIIIINLTRLAFLCYTFAHFSRHFFDINHSVIYVIITYALVFMMIVWWMRKFSGEEK